MVKSCTQHVRSQNTFGPGRTKGIADDAAHLFLVCVDGLGGVDHVKRHFFDHGFVLLQNAALEGRIEDFLDRVFARLVAESFDHLAKGEAEVKVTAPLELVRNRKARPDPWEIEIIEKRLLDPAWSPGQPFSAKVETNGRPAFRVMVPEYYVESCLVCHGSPKGEMDITGYPKEGRKLNDLGAVISITLYH